ncbi:MAG: Asp23/Gls24 family envelope stress response protein [Anaerolineales bacterium]|nr:Asp23/Gls24 family envelope stress response protein [Anaerolineales bacterium]
MSENYQPLGSINVSPRAVASIAHRAATRSYGVVGLANKNLVDGLTNLLVKDPSHGVDVTYDDNHIDIDIYIIIEYGTRIKSVANSVANSVRYQVEKSLDIPIRDVNVHVQGLRISE